MKITVRITKRNWETVCDEQEFKDKDAAIYQYTMGNYICDCNRSIFYGEPQDKCSESEYKVSLWNDGECFYAEKFTDNGVEEVQVAYYIFRIKLSDDATKETLQEVHEALKAAGVDNYDGLIYSTDLIQVERLEDKKWIGMMRRFNIEDDVIFYEDKNDAIPGLSNPLKLYNEIVAYIKA